MDGRFHRYLSHNCHVLHVSQVDRKNRIKLEDDCPIVFARCIQYLYFGEYDYDAHDGREGSHMIQTSEHTGLRYLLTSKPICLSPAEVGNDEPPEQEEGHAATGAESYTEIDISMYMLADKYEIPSLRQHTLDRLEQQMNYESMDYGGIFKSGHLFFRDFCDLDERLRKMLAQYISKHYKMIRTENGAEERKVRTWLIEDEDLALMVLDRLVGVEDSEVKRDPYLERLL